jgi:TonB-dependent receptor
MHHPKAKQKLMSLAVAAACSALVAPAFAQETAAAQSSGVEPPSPMQSVTVSGLRASLQSSLNLKRNADGIVDGIVAEDIGKFPDTNLAESLQRISGVSIDRSNGEGQKVTVRGVGPDFNLVLLNGRQMPTSNLGDLSGRAFDFSNLASESISQIQVYKSARSETPTGGIGATVNILTARPLDRPGTRGSVGVKGVYDTSNNNLPGDVKANHSYTPEISGIYSTTFGPDNQFGVALSASYQERNLGFNTAAVSNGWRGPFRGDENNWGTIPKAGTPEAAGITNHPKPGDIYSVPQNLNYNMNGVQRQRTNGQLTLQWQPIKSLTTTLDYTYSENKIQTKRSDVSAWFNFGPSTSTWSNGPVAGPLVYTELIPAGNSDIAMGAADFATKSENKSLGFNAVWKPSPNLRLELDTHHSTAESTPDSPFGSSNTLGTASFSRGNTSADFTNDFPILSIDGADFKKAPQQVTGSVFRNDYMRNKIDQTQFKGSWKVMEASNLNFGVAHTKSNNRSAFSVQQRDTWGGATKPEDYPSSVWHQDSVRQYFDNIKGSDSSKLFNTFYTFNLAEVRALVAKASGQPELYLPKTTFDTDRRTEEKSKSGYVQLGTEWDFVVPMHTNVGVRYETTDVVSSALVPTPISITMVSANEFNTQFGPAAFTTLGGKYSYWLPSLDWDADLRSDIKVRASYGETIGRPRYDQIQGGKVIDNLVRVNGGTGSQGNPALKPVKAKNTDLSAEWYYNEQSFASIGLFHKDLSDYSAQSKFTDTSAGLHTPVGGALWNEALAKGCASGDTVCIRNYIFRNHPTAPGVTRGPDDASHNATGTIVGQPGDPVASFEINSYANKQNATLHGAELNVQHMFGSSGFGIQANYTWVHSGLRYDNASIGEQFALVGLSNSYNLVGIYEDKKLSVRAAWNWRGEFLNSTFDGAGPNPQYTEPYGQLDLSVSYNLNDRLSFQFEAINLTDEIQRVHGRTKTMVLNVTQTGPRYMIGARYKF